MTTKKDIVRRIAAKYNLPQLQTRDVVQGLLDTIVEVLLDEERLELRDFGVFEIKERAQRKARNPKTGETVIVPRRRVVAFKPGKALEDKVTAAYPPEPVPGQEPPAPEAAQPNPGT